MKLNTLLHCRVSNNAKILFALFFLFWIGSLFAICSDYVVFPKGTFKHNGILYSITDSSRHEVACSGSYTVRKRIPVNVIGKGTKYVYVNVSSLADATTIIIPSTVTNDSVQYTVVSIKKKSFQNCSKLETVTFPSTIKTIGDSVFNNCDSLSSLEVSWPRPLSVNRTVFNGFDMKSCILYVPDEKLSLYEHSKVWYEFGKIMAISEKDNGTTKKDSIITKDSLIAKGSCGDKLTWTLDSIGILTISGNGEMTNWEDNDKRPWQSYNLLINRIIIENGVSNIGSFAFRECANLTSITIPSSVESIRRYAFYNCTGLTSITIPSSLKSVGNKAFTGTSIKELIYAVGCKTAIATGLKSINTVSIPNTVTSIESSAFEKCTGLTSIDIPTSVTSIGSHAFYGCTGLTSVTIPDSVASIGDEAFDGDTKIFVNVGSYALLALWNSNNLTPYSTKTGAKLEPSYLSTSTTTQTTATLTIKNKYDDYIYVSDGNAIKGNRFTIRNLNPESNEQASIYVRKSLNDNKVSYLINTTCLTKPLYPTISLSNSTASSITVSGSYTHGDAKVKEERMEILGTFHNGNSASASGLDPGESYDVQYQITLNSGKTYSANRSISTKALTITTIEAKVVNAGNVIISANTNLDDDEARVGFEWRRTDWPDDFTSSTGKGYLYNGHMEGYIRNLNANYLWRYRPYYESFSGTRYYGNWVGIDPSNTSYFDPTVHTYAKVNVSGNSAKVKGYAQRGTDNIMSQGFVYWKSGVAGSNSFINNVAGNTYYVSATDIPANAVTVEVSGTVMETTLQGLDFNSQYSYVAFVKTSEGETFYGAEQTFSIGEDPDGVISAAADTPTTTVSAGIYDLSGRRLPEMQKGINIVRYKDGTAKKVLVR